MKLFRIIAVAVLIFAGMAFATSAGAQDKKGKRAKTETVVFDVGITCANCQAKLEKHIPFEKGVKDMKTDLAKKQITVTFDPSRTTRAALKEAVEKLGYSCAIAGAEDPDSTR